MPLIAKYKSHPFIINSKMKVINLEAHRQALADYLGFESKEIAFCSARINNITTLQARDVLYLVGTAEEIEAGIRGYFEHNLGVLDTEFICSLARLEPLDARVVQRLCELLNEDIATDLLNDALLGIVRRCGDQKSLIDAAVAEVNWGEFLAEDGRESAEGDFLIYRFRKGRCSDIDY
ncbi:Uncharacterised protein [uncultured archaeon]|nr:Uncharacterised protein [uncultured archaeon]